MGILKSYMVKQWDRVAKMDAERLAAKKPVPGIITEPDIPFLDDGDAMHRLNVYYPENTSGLLQGRPSGCLPIIVNIHGGGWMYGTKDINRFYGMFMASLGFTVVGMNYRLLPAADLRDQVQDIFASLHWLDAHGREHHGDTDQVFLTGDSAGGHLATLVTCIEASKPLQKAYGVEPFTLKISAIAVNHGACDASLAGFTKGLVEVLATNEIRSMMLGKQKKKAPWYGKISFAETAEGIALPPLMLITSEQDPLNVQTFSMEQYLKSHHIPYRMKLWKKEQGERLGHVFNIGNPEWPESIETNREVGEFFKETMSKK